jgi:hypothetical protein
MLLNEKLKIFSEELKLVKTFSIKKFVIECLDEAPDYVFINCPSSSTGKYHTLDEFSPMGNILHTQRVVSNCNEMARAFSLEGKDRCLVIGSAILHDIVKQGFEQTGHTVSNHAELAAELVEKVFKTTKSKISKEDYETIRGCVFFHNGIWTPKPDNIPITSFTPYQLCVHMADYSATKFHSGGGESGNDIFSELKVFVDGFKTKVRVDDVTDIPIMLGKFFGAMCANVKNNSALEEKLMIIASWCIKSILYLRINKQQLRR